MRDVSRQLSQDRCSRILFVIGTERWGTRASWGLLHNKEDEGPAGAGRAEHSAASLQDRGVPACKPAKLGGECHSRRLNAPISCQPQYCHSWSGDPGLECHST